MGCMELSSSSWAKICIPIDLRRVSQGISGVAQGSQANRPVWWGMGHCSEAKAGELVIISSDLGYTELFHIPPLTSVSL